MNFSEYLVDISIYGNTVYVYAYVNDRKDSNYGNFHIEIVGAIRIFPFMPTLVVLGEIYIVILMEKVQIITYRFLSQYLVMSRLLI